jgi:MinD-like ATPase involved in chromosome partitioning or flagellar assembly
VLALNHCYQHSNYNLKDVERALGQPIAQEIEHAPTQVTTSLNRGVPLVDEYRSSPTAQSILKLARHISQRNGVEAPEPAEAESKQPAPKGKERKRRGLLFRRQATSRTG